MKWNSLVCLALLGAGSSHAAITLTGTNASLDTNNSSSTGYATTATFAADIANNDLANSGQASFSSAALDKTPFFGTAALLGDGLSPLTDGTGQGVGGARTVYMPETFGSVGKLPFTYTITFNTTVNTLGYDITTINTFAGWNQNGSAMANQKYEVLVSTVADAGFLSLGTFEYSPFNNANTAETGATKVTLTDTNGIIASGVDQIRFIFMPHGYDNTGIGTAGVNGTVYHEVDVIGLATTVPEPSIAMLGAFGAMALLRRRRL